MEQENEAKCYSLTKIPESRAINGKRYDLKLHSRDHHPENLQFTVRILHSNRQLGSES